MKENSAPRFKNLMRVPLWALYALIVSTVLLSVLIIAKIWFPEFFGEDFFWRVVLSYLTLIFSTYVIGAMSDVIKAVKSKENEMNDLENKTQKN
jgi:hypothetical protein